jgi:hypothetical protein
VRDTEASAGDASWVLVMSSCAQLPFTVSQAP